jgi:hypothetical protein
MTSSRQTDFDFLVGNWEVRNIRLKDRLVGSDEWIEFSGRLGDSRKLLDGLAMMDQMKTESRGE